MPYEMKLQKKYKRIVQSGAMNVFKWILVATDVIGVIRGGHLAPAPDRKTAPKRDRVTVQKAGRGASSHSQPETVRSEDEMANILTSAMAVFLLLTSGQSRSLSARQLESLGGNQLLGRALEDLDPEDFATPEKRSLDTLGGGVVLRSLDTLGGGDILRSRSLDTLGGSSILRSSFPEPFENLNNFGKRSLDTLGGGTVLRSRSLDTLGGSSILRSSSPDTFGRGRARSLDTLGGGSMLRSRSLGLIQSPTRLHDKRSEGYYPPLETLGGGNIF